MEQQWSAFFFRFIDILHALCVMQCMLWWSSESVFFEQQYLFIILISVICTLWLYPYFGLYQTWRGGSRFRELAIAALGWSFAFILVITALELAFRPIWLTLETAIIWYSVGLASLLIYKAVCRTLLNYYRTKGLNPRKIIVIGEGDMASMVIKHLTNAPWAGFQITGTFGQTPLTDYPYMGDDSDIDPYFCDGVPNGIDEVWFAMPMAQEDRIKDIMVALRNVTHTIRYVPDIFGFQLVNHSTTDVAGLSVFNVSMSPMQGVNRVIKRTEDIIIASVILLLIWPVMFVLAVLVKCTSDGPIFYRQERVSWNGELFDMLKFRSMATDNENQAVEWGGAKDKKVTPIGKFIRATSLDELPQFLNVLKGDMSIVGPRPERSVFVEQFKHDIPGYMQKHLVKAGITGWAQINGWRGDTDLHERIRHDLYYVSNWSLWFDLKIIVKTCFKLSQNAE